MKQSIITIALMAITAAVTVLVIAIFFSVKENKNQKNESQKNINQKNINKKDDTKTITNKILNENVKETKKKNKLISFWKANLAENNVCLLSLIINIFSSGLIWGLIATALFIFIEKIISNITGRKYIGLIVQIVLTILLLLLMAITIYENELAAQLRMQSYSYK